MINFYISLLAMRYAAFVREMKGAISILFLGALTISATTTLGQIPKSGTYEYEVAFAEWSGKSLGTTVTVVISGDSVKIINNGGLSGKKGDVIEYGKIVKHKTTGQWIIATKPEDEFANEVGGCSDGPRVIDFKNKKWLTC